MFDLGNLVAIGITLAVVVVFRILDRDNRSLEKVKRYADKLRDDMAVWADQRAEDLKNYAIELEVHQKAAKEVLKRVQSAEEALASRAGQIDGMAAKIAEYDKSLGELRDMSARVDVNLAAIRDESSFVDGVARTLKASKAEIEAIKASIVGVREGIQADARELGESLRQAFALETRSALDDAQAQIERLRLEAKAGAEELADTNAEAVRAAEERFKGIESMLSDAFKRAREEGERLEDSSFQKLRDQIDARSAKLSEAIESRFETLRDQAREKVAETQGLLKSFKAEWRKDADGILVDAEEEAKRTAERVDVRLAEVEGKIAKAEILYDERYAKIEAKALEAAQALQAKVRDALKAHQDDAQARQAAVRAAIKEGLAEAKANADAASQELSGKLAAFKSKLEGEASEQAARLDSMAVALAAAERKADATVSSLAAKFSDRGADLEKRVLSSFEARADELRGVVEQGLSRLEAVRLDADRMEKALRDSMAGVERRVGEDFALFGKDLAARQASFEAEFKAESARVHAAVKDLDADINALKSKAYADVSEKLKIFEDEFFADLHARREDADSRFATWRTEMDERLAASVREADAARETVNKAWADESRAALAQAQARVQDQLGKLTAQVDAHRQAIGERVAESGEALVSLRASVKADLDDARQAADAFLNAELERWKHESAERVRGAERQSELDGKALADATDAAKARFEAARSALESESQAWKKEFSAAIKTAEAERQSAVSSLAESFKTDVAAIADNWEKERRKVVESAKLERDALVRDVRTLSDEVGRFRQELAQKTAQALDDFSRSYEGLSQDAARKTREAVSTMNAAIEDYRREAKALKEGFESAKAQAASSLDEERKEREKAFAEMDRQVKAFQAQTRLFERADELKASLGEAMESMKADLTRVEARRAEMAELETQYVRVKRLEDELGQKIARFLAEKRRLDTMEDDFKRLLSLSQAVDQKLAAVTSSNDQLTQVQAEVRRLSEAADEAAEKYERLEKKSNILDSTADAVDKNFEAIGELERNVRTIDADVRDMPDRVIDLKRSLDEVAAWKPKLDQTVARLDEVDSILTDAERRAGELQKAREWLARAETRFDELNKKTQDHLKLLSDILKEDPAKGRKEKGAPSLSVQETVRKLSHQGWKVEEIARAVKLSRGEVELILELGGQE